MIAANSSLLISLSVTFNAYNNLTSSHLQLLQQYETFSIAKLTFCQSVTICIHIPLSCNVAYHNLIVSDAALNYYSVNQSIILFNGLSNAYYDTDSFATTPILSSVNS